MSQNLLSIEPAARAVIAVVRYREGWRIFASGRRWGRFDYRVDAEEAALRLAGRTLADGRPAEVLVQDASGELHPLHAGT